MKTIQIVPESAFLLDFDLLDINRKIFHLKRFKRANMACLTSGSVLSVQIDRMKDDIVKSVLKLESESKGLSLNITTLIPQLKKEIQEI